VLRRDQLAGGIGAGEQRLPGGAVGAVLPLAVAQPGDLDAELALPQLLAGRAGVAGVVGVETARLVGQAAPFEVQRKVVQGLARGLGRADDQVGRQARQRAEGREGLYLVDGYGSKQLIPVYSWSKSLNGRRILRRYDTMTKKLLAASERRR